MQTNNWVYDSIEIRFFHELIYVWLQSLILFLCLWIQEFTFWSNSWSRFWNNSKGAIVKFITAKTLPMHINTLLQIAVHWSFNYLNDSLFTISCIYNFLTNKLREWHLSFVVLIISKWIKLKAALNSSFSAAISEETKGDFEMNSKDCISSLSILGLRVSTTIFGVVVLVIIASQNNKFWCVCQVRKKGKN